MRWALLCGMSVGMALALLIMAVIIRVTGAATFVEPRVWILYVEMAMLVAIIGYTIWLTIQISRR